MSNNSNSNQLKVSAMQITPVYLDRNKTLTLVVEYIIKADKDKVDLLVFPESFVPGYPDWIWRKNPWDDSEWYKRFQDQSVSIGSGDLDKVCSAAKKAGVWVALGLTEKTETGSLYNSVVYINRSGKVETVHRKLMLTGAERLIWANGQDSVLKTVNINGVTVGSLICWEMYMPLARAAMYEQKIDVLLAPTWDNSDEWISTLRHTAKEGRVFVVGTTAFLRGCDVPRDLPGANEIYKGNEDWMSKGNSTIVAPGGEVIAGPLIGKAGVVTAELDITQIASNRRIFDPSGHYSRPDILTLNTNLE